MHFSKPTFSRLADLRKAMALADGEKGVQAFIVPTEDPHMSGEGHI